MGCTVREKHMRANRRTRSLKPEFDPCAYIDRASISKSIFDSGIKSLKYHLGHLGLKDSTQNHNSCNNNPNTQEDNGWGYCTEEQLEEIF